MLKNKLIRLSKSIVDKQEAASLCRVLLEDGYLGMGQEVRLFEEEFKEFLEVERWSVSIPGLPHCIWL